MRLPVEDFLLYVQQISLCESLVRVASHGTNDLTLTSRGELLSVRIQNHSPPAVPPVSVVHCTFKYMRAILSILQKVDTLDIVLIDQAGMYIEVPIGTGTLSVLLKDKTAH